jgi:hypothetical protein
LFLYFPFIMTSPDRLPSSLLPANYHPCPKTFIVGRGRVVTSHPGNQFVLDLVKDAAPRYLAASSNRELKTEIIGHVASAVRNHSKGSIGFVKQDKSSGRWMVVEEALARSAVGQAFRNFLEGYRSSKQSKQARRLKGKQVQGVLAVATGLPPFSTIPSLARVVSMDGPVEQSEATKELPELVQGASDQSCFDRLYALLAMDDQPITLQGNPYEPRPIQEAPLPRTQVLNTATISRSSALQEAADRTNRARSYIAKLQQGAVISVPLLLLPHRQVSPDTTGI